MLKNESETHPKIDIPKIDEKQNDEKFEQIKSGRKTPTTTQN